MKSRSFGRTGESVGEVGLGTWQLGGTDWGQVDERHALDTLSAAVEGGVSFFDTAGLLRPCGGKDGKASFGGKDR